MKRLAAVLLVLGLLVARLAAKAQPAGEAQPAGKVARINVNGTSIGLNSLNCGWVRWLGADARSIDEADLTQQELR